MSHASSPNAIRLHVNIDHVATVRNARGTAYPCPVEAAVVCMASGADGITAHLREDRRHIRDEDVRRLRERISGTFNFEMAATDEMVAIAIATKPDIVTLVPERREERTTEGGLDVIGGGAALRARVEALVRAGVPVSLFIAPSEEQLRASAAIGARDPASRYGGSGLGLYGSVGRPQLFVAPLTFWLFEIALAVAWTSRFRFGPLEALWRGLYRGDFSLGGGERHGSSGPG